jgi:hypothetical protein
MRDELQSVVWIRDLARPYLSGFSPEFEDTSVLRGYRFLRSPGRGKTVQVGFFAGFLLAARGFESFEPAPPECVLFAFVRPLRGPLHRQLVLRADGLFRSTHRYISWLTHRPPRFQFSEAAAAALIRHLPVSCWPEGRRAHYARNFLTEGLAWLVRSALVRRLASENLQKEAVENRYVFASSAGRA